MTSADGSRGWQSIGRAVDVLEAVGSHDRPVSVADIVRELGMTMSTTHRIMRGLEARGFMLRDPLSGEYSIGPSILRLARSMLQQTADGDLALSALPRMQRLRELTSETVGFHVPSGLRRLCLAELASHEPIRMASGVGASYILGVGASGKALLAFSPQETIDKVTSTAEFRAGSAIGTTPSAVERALERVRADGYAMSFGETVPGAAAIAVPVCDSRGQARAAINLTGPASRWTTARMLENLPLVMDAKTWTERRLGRESSDRGSVSEVATRLGDALAAESVPTRPQVTATMYRAPTPDEDSASFWAHLADHRLVLQRCVPCDRLRFPPGPTCPYCGGREYVEAEMTGSGEVYSFVSVQRALVPEFAGDVPYSVAVVQLDEGVRLVARVHGTAGFGHRVRARFEDREGWTELGFEPQT